MMWLSDKCFVIENTTLKDWKQDINVQCKLAYMYEYRYICKMQLPGITFVNCSHPIIAHLLALSFNSKKKTLLSWIFHRKKEISLHNVEVCKSSDQRYSVYRNDNYLTQAISASDCLLVSPQQFEMKVLQHASGLSWFVLYCILLGCDGKSAVHKLLPLQGPSSVDYLRSI